jgi:hypothetical protein
MLSWKCPLCGRSNGIDYLSCETCGVEKDSLSAEDYAEHVKTQLAAFSAARAAKLEAGAAPAEAGNCSQGAEAAPPATMQPLIPAAVAEVAPPVTMQPPIPAAAVPLFAAVNCSQEAAATPPAAASPLASVTPVVGPRPTKRKADELEGEEHRSREEASGEEGSSSEEEEGADGEQQK